MAALGHVDAIIFTAGVGERGPIVRDKCLDTFESLGVKVDNDKNYLSMTRNAETDITGEGSEVKVFVIPTDEELVMTEDTYALTQGNYDVHTNFTYTFQDPNYVNKAREKAFREKLKEKPDMEKLVAKPPKK